MKILVTGSSGYIGSALRKLLNERQHHVFGLDMNEPKQECGEFLKCDIRDRTALFNVVASVKPDVVIHLAARIDLEERDSLDGYSANIQGVTNLIDAVQEGGTCKRVIFTSSQLVCKPGYIPKTDEDYKPHTLYGESKVLTEQIVRKDAVAICEWCIARPTTVWGPGMSPHYQQMLRLIKGRKYFHCGSSQLLKSYSYIGNIAWQYMKLAEASAESMHQKTFYLADYEPLSLRQYADDLSILMGRGKVPTFPLMLVKLMAYVGDVLTRLKFSRIPFNTFRLNNILTEYVFDLSETNAVCGPLPYTYDEGVRATVDWFEGKGQNEDE